VSNTDTVTDYRERAEQHRPQDAIALAAAIRGLTESGLKAHDISVLLGIGVGAVLQVLGNG
jgi:hypothetical protein